jgi:hypothetical protein
MKVPMKFAKSLYKKTPKEYIELLYLRHLELEKAAELANTLQVALNAALSSAQRFARQRGIPQITHAQFLAQLPDHELKRLDHEAHLMADERTRYEWLRKALWQALTALTKEQG